MEKHAKVQEINIHSDIIEELKKTNGQIITCKAAVAWGPKQPLDVTDIQVAPPKAKEVRVKVIANALCHTDIYTLDGDDPEGIFPSILGHEATAIVESVGEGVTSLQVGDIVIPCYTPECRRYDCIYCQSQDTNLCPQIRATQGKGLMPDGTTRFSKDGKQIFHFMGCSTFSEYSVIAEISAAKINGYSDLNKVCMLGCGLSTGWGAVINASKVKPCTSAVIFGLGAVGLSVIQAAKQAGCSYIVGVDLNGNKFEKAIQLGASECVNPATLPDKDVKKWLLEKQKWGFDYSYDCTGNTAVMRDALEVAHRGWGQSCVIGVAAAGKELSTRPFQLVTGRVWKGTAFGGWKSRTEVPKLVQQVVRGELNIDPFITSQIQGLERVNETIEALHSGECLRAIVQISPYKLSQPIPEFQQISNQKVFGGYLKHIKHFSCSNQSFMKFSIFIPKQKERCEEAPAVLVYLPGQTKNDGARLNPSVFCEHASRYNLAVLFPDASPIDVQDESSDFGNQVGFYLNATTEKWRKNLMMNDYISYELLDFVGQIFTLNTKKIAITGFSTGGHGALTLFLRNPEKFLSASAFAPVCNPTKSSWGQKAFLEQLGSVEEGVNYDFCELVKKFEGPKKLILVDQGTDDIYLKNELRIDSLKEACGISNYPLKLRMNQGYDHSFLFVQTFIKDHIDFHATNLGLHQRN